MLLSVSDPSSRTTSFEYDADHNLTKTTSPDTTIISRTYTADDLLASLSGPSVLYSYTYGPTHLLTRVTDQADRAFDFTYNPVGWLTSSADTVDPAITGGFSLTRAYDAAGRTTGIRASGEATRTYGYDLRGALTSMTLPTDPSGRTTTMSYDQSGLRTGLSLPDGSLTGYAYDAAGRLASITATMPSGVSAQSYTRDANGQITGENATRYTYDDLGRLATWYDPSTDTTTTYTYDDTYNLVQASTPATVTKAFTYDASDRITNSGFAYDTNGNLTAKPGYRYSYDALNRLTSVVDASTEATIAAYAYDFMNRRIKTTEGATTTFFHYDGASANVIAETDGAGITVASYAHDAAGNLHSMTRSGQTYYYHVNAHGDVLSLTDANGSVVNSYRYDPWGTLIDSDETVENPYRYASYRFDGSTGLSYCWNRYYAPELGRFLTRDIYPGETSDPVTMNPYLYCGGDPVNRVDPLGLAPWNEWLGLGTGGVLVIAAAVAGVAGFPAWAAFYGVSAAALALEAPIIGTIAYLSILKPGMDANYADIERWKEMSARARAENRCEQADKMDAITRDTAVGLNTIRANSWIEIIRDSFFAVGVQ